MPLHSLTLITTFLLSMLTISHMVL